MKDKLAGGISYFFHPLMIPLYVLLMLLGLNSFFSLLVPLSFKLALTGIVVLTTVLFPLIITFLLRRLKIISSFYLEQKEDRIFPILCSAVFYYLTYYLLKRVQFASLFSYFMLGVTLLAIIALVLTFYSKISLHMIGMGSLTGLFLGLTLNFGPHFLNLFFIGVLCSGLVGFARLYLNAHKPAEIYSGFFLGVMVLSILIMLL